MTIRTKLATSTFVAAVLSVGIATANAAHKPGPLATRHAHPVKHAHFVVHVPPGALKLPGPVVCRLPACRPSHGPGGVGSDDGSGQPGSADHGDDGSGGGGGHECVGDRDCAPFKEN
jgi:hypothetical protein